MNGGQEVLGRCFLFCDHRTACKKIVNVSVARGCKDSDAM